MKPGIDNITLAFCCNEDWNSFASIDDKSKFCGACKRRVVDFTQVPTDNRDLEMPISLITEKVCGRFKLTQMSSVFLQSLATAIIVSGITTGCTHDQHSFLTNSTHTRVRVDDRIVMGIPVESSLSANQHFKIVDDSGNEVGNFVSNVEPRP